MAVPRFTGSIDWLLPVSGPASRPLASRLLASGPLAPSRLFAPSAAPPSGVAPSAVLPSPPTGPPSEPAPFEPLHAQSDADATSTRPALTLNTFNLTVPIV